MEEIYEIINEIDDEVLEIRVLVDRGEFDIDQITFRNGMS